MNEILLVEERKEVLATQFYFAPNRKRQDLVMDDLAVRHQLTKKPCAKGSRSSIKIVLMPVIRAQPAMEGMIAL